MYLLFVVREAFGEFVSDWSPERFVERCEIYRLLTLSASIAHFYGIRMWIDNIKSIM